MSSWKIFDLRLSTLILTPRKTSTFTGAERPLPTCRPPSDLECLVRHIGNLDRLGQPGLLYVSDLGSLVLHWAEVGWKWSMTEPYTRMRYVRCIIVISHCVHISISTLSSRALRYGRLNLDNDKARRARRYERTFETSSDVRDFGFRRSTKESRWTCIRTLCSGENVLLSYRGNSNGS